MEHEFTDPLKLKEHPPAPPMQFIGDRCRCCGKDFLKAVRRYGKPSVIVCPKCDSIQKWPLHA